MAKAKKGAKAKAKAKVTTRKAAKAAKPARKAAAKRRAAPRPRPPAAAAKPAVPAGPGVVHWEIQARDAAAQQRFYADLFGWNVDAANPMGYGMVKGAGGSSIGGGIGSTMDEPRATFYVWVPSIDAALERAAALGGQAIMPRTDLGMVVMGQFRDPEGNVIGLVEGEG
ncbi:MAG TPA: VOC family protein [Polyangia bacterium]|nr:VOC family protein [Polyangia bacterium]